jgi:hypothetical protein
MIQGTFQFTGFLKKIVRNILESVALVMDTSEGGVAHQHSSVADQKKYAKDSRNWVCDKCGPLDDLEKLIPKSNANPPGPRIPVAPKRPVVAEKKPIVKEVDVEERKTEEKKIGLVGDDNDIRVTLVLDPAEEKKKRGRKPADVQLEPKKNGCCHY